MTAGNLAMRWGPQPLANGGTRFALWAPSLKEPPQLELRDGEAVVMSAADEPGWYVAHSKVPPGSRYRFRLPSGLAVPDPASRAQDGGVHGWSVLVHPGSYQWRTVDWRGRPWREAVIWECHAGVLGGFASVRDKLSAIAELGFTVIELMPVAAFAGSRNWGYDGVLPYAPAETYGTPEALMSLVDEAHRLGLAIHLDVVYNHFGPDGNYLGAYAEQFFNRADTPWGAAVATAREPVARFFIDNALMWLGDYGFDGLRFDAVHAIADNAFLDSMASELRAAFPDRAIHLVLENDANDPDRLSGAYDAQWNDDFHNALHVLLTGESDGYYGAFSSRPTQLLTRTLEDGFAFQGEEFDRAHARGAPSGHLSPTAFVNFLQNHDQVGNRAHGERLISLIDRQTLRAGVALLLLTPFIPLVFMGEETGSRTPFLFFTDFTDELADAVREGRRNEFASFPAFSNPVARGRIPDPNSADTFAASIPQPGPDADEWRALYGKLLAIRAREIVPHLDGCRSAGAQVDGGELLQARWRLGNGALLTVMARFSNSQSRLEESPGRELFRTGYAAAGPCCIVTLEEA